MAWRAGNKQATSALRARNAAAANRLPAAKVLCIQWARTAPRKLSKARPMTMPPPALTSAMRAATHKTCLRGAPSARRTPNSSTLRDAISDDAEDANQRERERHGRETPNNMEKSRWRLYCASRSMASLRVKVP